jgi:hypothetical protein
VLLRRRLSVVWAAAIMMLTVLACSGIALAITNGWVDDGRADNAQEPSPNIIKYPYVGALVDRFDGETYPYCTGTLISPTVLLTAAHCYPETRDHFYVTFKAKPTSVMSQDQGLRGTWHEHSTIDIGVVKFAQPVSGITPAKLPTAGQVARRAQSTNEFTAVGYGGELAPKEPGGPLIVYGDQREWAVSTYKSFNGTYLRLSQNQGSGGTCYGDSGGPNFFGEYGSDYDNDPNTSLPRPTIASTTITGDTWCKATNVTLRLDTEPVRAFLKQQGVTVP